MTTSLILHQPTLKRCFTCQQEAETAERRCACGGWLITVLYSVITGKRLTPPTT